MGYAAEFVEIASRLLILVIDTENLKSAGALQWPVRWHSATLARLNGLYAVWLPESIKVCSGMASKDAYHGVEFSRYLRGLNTNRFGNRLIVTAYDSIEWKRKVFERVLTKTARYLRQSLLLPANNSSENRRENLLIRTR